MSSTFSEKSTKFSKNLERLRNLLGLKTSGLERYLGLSNGYINNFLKTDAENPGKLLVALNEKGISTDWFLSGEGTPFIKIGIGASAGYAPPGETGIGAGAYPQTLANLPAVQNSAKIPLLKQKVSCGSGVNWETEENIEEYIEVDMLIPRLGIGRLFAVKAQGSSMLGAGIHGGDYIFFDGSAEQTPVDGIYVFALDGDVYCKRLEFDNLARKVKIFSVRVADLEKAELLTALDTNDTSFADRFFVFGKVTRCIRLIDIGE
jgi:transcriptional regulator with XRE-family HTH domain